MLSPSLPLLVSPVSEKSTLKLPRITEPGEEDEVGVSHPPPLPPSRRDPPTHASWDGAFVVVTSSK